MALMYQFNAAKKKTRYIRAKINPVLQSLDTILSGCSKQTCCVFWFIGKTDLTQGSLDVLYSKKGKRVEKLLEKGCEVYLTDLMAWRAFEEQFEASYNCKSQFESVIFSLREKGIAYLGSNCFFQKLFETTNLEIIAWINQICKRDALYLASEKESDNERRLLDLVKDKSMPILQITELANKPLSKLYSVFQYIEIFFYIEYIIKDQLARSNSSLNIQFILPSDEYRYYLNFPDDIKMSNAQLEQDLEMFLKINELETKIKSLEISIECFNFCKNKKARPYNSGTIVSQEDGELQLLSIIKKDNIKKTTMGI